MTALRDYRWLGFALLIFVAGCGTKPEKYTVSGNVRHAGELLANGSITFEAAPGNRGASFKADIVAGKYETPRGRGISGGTYTVRIEPESIPSGTKVSSSMLRFKPFTSTVELPADNSVRDFDIPK